MQCYGMQTLYIAIFYSNDEVAPPIPPRMESPPPPEPHPHPQNHEANSRPEAHSSSPRKKSFQGLSIFNLQGGEVGFNNTSTHTDKLDR